MSSSDFLEAVKAGDKFDVVKLLDGDPALLELPDEAGATPLHYAALNGHREIVRYLIERGANVNCLDEKFGATPAGWAIEYLRRTPLRSATPTYPISLMPSGNYQKSIRCGLMQPIFLAMV